jgi:GNAT superfamily N-acetyltransferase
MEYNAVHGFIRSLAHRERVEVGATVREVGMTTEIRYASALDWPWPRKFAYTREFFSQGPPSESLEAIRAATAKAEEHVVNFFSPELDSEAAKFVETGYVQAWVSKLLGRNLSQQWARPLVTGVAVFEVASPEDMERYASLPGISNPGTARDSSIHNFFAVSGGEVIAKGQLVYLSGAVGYVSDMFTKPEHRRKGLCTVIMSALESKALRLGATHACLAPGYEVASFGLYEKYGYTTVGVRSVLIPSREVASAA